jgi:uncharacterized membrane protein
MKKEYLSTLRSLLSEYNMDSVEVEDIISDYDDMYTSYIAQGMLEDEVEAKLGSPESILPDLTEGYVRKQDHKKQVAQKNNGKIIAITPFIALVTFFILGFAFDLWAYSWTAFLLIPITAIVLSTDFSKETIIALSPFAAVIAYGILGFGFDLWHPGWLVFLVIPVLAITLERKGMKLVELATALSPFAALVIYFTVFGPQDQWDPGWLIFLMIPIIGVLNEENKLKVLLWEGLFLIGIVGYLYLRETMEVQFALLAFAPVVLYALFMNNFIIFQMPKDYRYVVLGAIAIYVILGYLSDAIGMNMWLYAWLIFLAIPLYAINKETEGGARLIASAPFIALIIFFTLGYFFDGWVYSWMAFLIIPVIAILKGDD